MARTTTQVYLDMNALTQPRVTGIGKYCIELHHGLKSLIGISKTVDLHPTIKFSRLKHIGRVHARIDETPTVFGISSLLHNEPQVYHGLDFRVPVSTKAKKVVTIHDLISFEQVFNEVNFVEEAKRNFEDMLFKCVPDHFICISKATQEKFAFHYPELAKNSTVVYLGCDHQVVLQEGENPGPAGVALPARYILFLGTLEERKNPAMVIKAFSKLASRFPDLHLVLAGSIGFKGKETLRDMGFSPYKDRIHHLSYVTDSLVDTLYRNAEAFVFPSLLEGFGLPILEAMKRGCPVVTSKGGATEEVSGDAATLVDPTNENEVTEAVFELLTKSDLRQDLISHGWNRSQKFTWQETAEQTLAVYQKLVK
ncbi:MAG: glycosyltransferase family 1 protein [Bdellovibrionota bacterium]